VWESVGEYEGMNPHIAKLEFQWILEFSKSDYRGQNPLDRRVFISLKSS